MKPPFREVGSKLVATKQGPPPLEESEAQRFALVLILELAAAAAGPYSMEALTSFASFVG
ncbi:hypothetical protein RchiOBHm_Chr3g0481421 [Rosa chinensis]|uniref:Uncharacterized protein n=1 Tax=Rosa chinensis TaxID=74649 RepID=A0A2P6RDZ5_ROSCH|nr:hypothetical protein RchiOBHm_Chr3g0481421 [Rosa chinensis]